MELVHCELVSLPCHGSYTHTYKRIVVMLLSACAEEETLRTQIILESTCNMDGCDLVEYVCHLLYWVQASRLRL